MSDDTSVSSFTTYRRLLGYLLRHWAIFLISVIGFSAFAASQAAVAELMEHLINTIESGDRKDQMLVPLALSGIAFLRGIGYFIGNYGIARVALSIVHELRTELFNSMTRLPGDYFDKHPSGHLVSVIIFNVMQVTGAATKAVKVVISEGLTVIVLFGYLLWKDWRLTMVFVVIAPVMSLLVMQVGKRLRKLSKRIQTAMGNITQVTSEMIIGYRVMRTFGGEEYERGRFHKASKDNYRRNLKLEATSAAATPVMQFIIASAMGVLIYLAMQFMETANSGAFVAYISAAFLISKPMRMLSSVYSTIQQGLAASESIFAQLDMPGEPDTGTYTAAQVQGNIAIKGLEFGYGPDLPPVIKDFNLEIGAGQIVALVGRSGSGKTTLASLIPRFYAWQKGEILVDGVASTDYTLTNLRSHIAIVNQDVVLFDDTIANNIAYGGLQGATREQIRDAARAANALDFIEALPEGFDTMIGEDGARLSGGQRQRLAIARALLKDAPILILDEATSALDTESEHVVQEALDKLMKGRTTIVIAHRLSTIRKADKIVVMDSGRIAETGTHDELLARHDGTYAKLHGLQFQDG